MTIDWSKEIETTEDPPRPVRVLFDGSGEARAVEVAGYVLSLKSNGMAGSGSKSVCLRNVAPPKPGPVMLEGWLNLYRNGALTVHFSDDDAQVCNPNGAAETRRIAWMSDGSPVPSEASGEEPDIGAMSVLHMEKQGLEEQRDHWKAKAEALQASLEEARQQRDDASVLVERMKPVVDAAVAWSNAEGNEAIILTGRALMDASRAYQSQQAPAKPVKSCTTCRFCKLIQVGAPCVNCHDFSEWRNHHE